MFSALYNTARMPYQTGMAALGTPARPLGWDDEDEDSKGAAEVGRGEVEGDLDPGESSDQGSGDQRDDQLPVELERVPVSGDAHRAVDGDDQKGSADDALDLHPEDQDQRRYDDESAADAEEPGEEPDARPSGDQPRRSRGK